MGTRGLFHEFFELEELPIASKDNQGRQRFSMKDTLKSLYKHLIVEGRRHEFKGWYDGYCTFYAEVQEIRKRIKEGQGLSGNDEDFLNRLLYKRHNGIASKGQSALSKDDFQTLIQDRQFLSVLERFIVTPDHEGYLEFEKVWRQKKKSNNPAIINRVAAACTLEVSTTIALPRFKKVFDRLISENMIPSYSAEAQDWFSKNQFLLNNFKEQFASEREDKTTDEFRLSQFVWALYEHYFPNE